MRGVGLRAGARHRRARIGDQPLQQRDRPRRGGDELARPRAQPQAELQHVEGGFGIAPLGQFVAPGGVELRPAQAFGIVGREGFRHRAVRPFQPAARRATAAARRAATCARARPGLRSSPRARRARSRRPARCGGSGRRRKAPWPCTSARTHSAPSRVLPAPRPPSASQVVHGPPLLAATGGSWWRCASVAKSLSASSTGRQSRQSPSASPASVRLATNASMRRARSRRNSSMSKACRQSSRASCSGHAGA